MIVTATDEDLGPIMVIERSGFEADQQWSEAAWRAELQGSDRVVLVARDHGDLDGVITLQLVAGTADLHRVVVRYSARRAGLATALVGEGIARVARAGAERVLLEVELDNVPARALYQSLGFGAIAERRHYYGPGRHALVLSRDLGGMA